MERPLCSCGKNCKPNGFNVDGSPRYHSRCSYCLKKIHKQGIPGNQGGKCGRSRINAVHKKDHCELCGFIPEDSVQLDLDHIDGNRHNHTPSNFQTLCANCHRLKTKQNNDNGKRY